MAQPAARSPQPAARSSCTCSRSTFRHGSASECASGGHHTELGRVNSLIGDAHAKQRRIDELEGDVAQLQKKRGAQPIDAKDIVASR